MKNSTALKRRLFDLFMPHAVALEKKRLAGLERRSIRLHHTLPR